MPRIVTHIVDAFVYRIRTDGVEFLILRRSPESRLGGTWHAVHGHVEPGETSFEAAVREVEEETKLSAEAWHQLESVNTFFVSHEDEIHMCPGFAVRVAADAEPMLNHEHDAFEWVTTVEAMERFHWPGQQRAVREICELILADGPHAASLRIEHSANEKRR